MSEVKPSGLKVWTCKIVVDATGELPHGFDSPPRIAAQEAIEAAGFDVVMNSSGWGGKLDDHDIRYLESAKLMAEDNEGHFSPVGGSPESMQGWREVPGPSPDLSGALMQRR